MPVSHRISTGRRSSSNSHHPSGPKTFRSQFFWVWPPRIRPPCSCCCVKNTPLPLSTFQNVCTALFLPFLLLLDAGFSCCVLCFLLFVLPWLPLCCCLWCCFVAVVATVFAAAFAAAVEKPNPPFQLLTKCLFCFLLFVLLLNLFVLLLLLFFMFVLLLQLLSLPVGAICAPVCATCFCVCGLFFFCCSCCFLISACTVVSVLCAASLCAAAFCCSLLLLPLLRAQLAPTLQTPPKFHEKKSENGGRGKKGEILGSPAEGVPRRGPEGWCPEGWGTRLLGPEGWRFKGCTPKPRKSGARRGPNFALFFSSPATIFILSSSLGGRFVEFWWCD